jgi:hypothetical protein
MVFATPELIESEPIHVINELKISLQLQRRVLPDRVVGCQERAEP